LSNHRAHQDSPEQNEKWIDEIESRQRNIVFPDTVRNGRSVDELLWKGSPDAPLVQRIGIALFGLTFAAGSVVFFWAALTRTEGWADMTASIAIGVGFLILGGHLCLNAFIRRKRAALKSKHF
jgi:hypothetical protein